MADWKTELNEFYQGLETKAEQTAQQQDQAKLVVQNFFLNVVTPAFAELKEGFEQLGRRVTTEVGTESASIAIYKGEDLEYDMDIKTNKDHVYPVIPFIVAKGKSLGEAKSFKKNFKEMTKDDLVQSFLNVYKNFISHHSG